MKKKTMRARLKESAGMRHARIKYNPARSPGSTNNRAGCGPLPPIAIGSGGRATAATRKAITQRAGARSSHKQPAAASAAPASPRQSSIIREARISIAGLEHDVQHGKHKSGEDRRAYVQRDVGRGR